MATFYAARSEIITPLPWLTFALPFSPLTQEGKSGRILLRPQQDYPAATVVQFCTAVLTFKGLAGWGDRGCRGLSAQAVFIEWLDYEGNHGFE